ncbi:conjugal transfer protein TraD [Fluoribacter gormanii]|uniref:conjugal transfer protein TraD n=1 Tax=Fluoribacter gormanii TaxID=464 RepID=UPI00224324B7|nr:conjugal transfer protein TraD [Fluoribacter gormanii]MCW8470622.1 conjugal transfer protein TraD [Fluoribacter gormanii]
MPILEQIKKEEQLIARCEKSIALEKLRKRRADTRHKIELGGLVIKSGMGVYNKSVVLGSLDYISKLILKDESYKRILELSGNELFKKKLNKLR